MLCLHSGQKSAEGIRFRQRLLSQETECPFCPASGNTQQQKTHNIAVECNTQISQCFPSPKEREAERPCKLESGDTSTISSFPKESCKKLSILRAGRGKSIVKPQSKPFPAAWRLFADTETNATDTSITALTFPYLHQKSTWYIPNWSERDVLSPLLTSSANELKHSTLFPMGL